MKSVKMCFFAIKYGKEYILRIWSDAITYLFTFYNIYRENIERVSGAKLEMYQIIHFLMNN